MSDPHVEPLSAGTPSCLHTLERFARAGESYELTRSDALDLVTWIDETIGDLQAKVRKQPRDAKQHSTLRSGCECIGCGSDQFVCSTLVWEQAATIAALESERDRLREALESVRYALANGRATEADHAAHIALLAANASASRKERERT